MNNNSAQQYLSVVVPVFNEEGNIIELYKRIEAVFSGLSYDFELIIVDDGSEDTSLECVRELHLQDNRVKYLSFTRNFGHEIASTAGLEMASGMAVILMDADLQDPPECIPEFIEKWHQGYDIVYAHRKERMSEPLVNRITSFFFYRILNRLSKVHLPLDVGDFRLMDAVVVRDFLQCKEKNRYVRGLLSWVGYKQTGITFQRAPRTRGKTKYNSLRRLTLALDAITSFSVLPLRVCLLIGFLVVLFSMLAAMYVIIRKLFVGIPIPGYAFLIVSQFFLGGTLLFVMGIIGEYVCKIFIEVQNRPLYLLKEKVGCGDSQDERCND